MVPLDQFEALAAELIAFDDLAIKIGAKAPVAQAETFASTPQSRKQATLENL
jgi:hypothetical protein